jgi:uncharacterized membrane protein
MQVLPSPITRSSLRVRSRCRRKKDSYLCCMRVGVMRMRGRFVVGDRGFVLAVCAWYFDFDEMESFMEGVITKHV